jgi:hypothetical protein
MLDLSYFVKSLAISFQTLHLLGLVVMQERISFLWKMAGLSIAVRFYGLTGRL